MITGVVTGADMNLSNNNLLTLQFGGFKGEEVTDDRVFFIKTHHPLATNNAN